MGTLTILLLFTAVFVLGDAADTDKKPANNQPKPGVEAEEKKKPEDTKLGKDGEEKFIASDEQSSEERRFFRHHRSSEERHFPRRHRSSEERRFSRRHRSSEEDLISRRWSSSEEDGVELHGRKSLSHFIRNLRRHLRIKPNHRMCPHNWHAHGTHCYVYVPFRTQWTNAERNCLLLGGNLASVHGPNQYRFLLSMIEINSKKDQRTWIGGNDAVQEGFWVWSDGSRFHYRNWSRGQPSDSRGRYRSRENCMEINHGADRGQNDVACRHKKPFLCSRKI